MLNGMQDNTEESDLLLGCSGWPHPEWKDSYFPEDLPEDWQFAYCANDCSCFLLPASTWTVLGEAELADWLDDIQDNFRFYFEMPEKDVDLSMLMRFSPYVGAVLGGKQPLPGQIPRLTHSGDGQWLNVEGAPVLWRWTLKNENLRDLRMRFEQMPSSVQALVIDGENVDPGRLNDIRTLAELLGVA